MAELPHTFTVREIGEIRHEGEDTFNGVVLEGSKEAIRSIAPLFGEKVILAALSTQEARMVKVKQLEWRADHGVAGHGPYRLFEAFTPIGRFSYGTDSEGSPWWCAQYGGIFTVGDEDTAKRLAEAAWSKAALDEAAKFVDLSPAPDMREAVEALTKAVHAHYVKAFEDYGIAREVLQADPEVYHGALDTIDAALRSLTGAKP